MKNDYFYNLFMFYQNLTIWHTLINDMGVNACGEQNRN